MTQEIQLRNQDNLPDLADPFAGYDRQGEAPANIFLQLHRLLRNRYKWCALLMVLGMALGGAVAFKVTKPIYVTNGLVQIRPVISPVLSKIYETDQLPLFAEFLQSQIALIKDPRVIDMALHSDDWKKLNRPYSEDMVVDFMDRLNVATAPKSQIIVVSFTDPDPLATLAAVRSIMTAYYKIYVETDIRAQEKTRNTLEDRRLDLANRVRDIQEQIRRMAGELLTEDNIKNMVSLEMRNLEKLQEALHEVDFELAKANPQQPSATQPSTQPAATQPIPIPIPILSVPDIAVRDVPMRQFLHERRVLQTDLDMCLKTWGEKHSKIVELRAQLTGKSREIEEYAQQYRDAWNLGQSSPSTVSGFKDLAKISPAELFLRQQRYKEMYEDAKTRLNKLGRSLAEIEKLRKQEEQYNQDLARTIKRLDELAIEAPQGRIQLANDSDLRHTLYKDSRVIRTTAGTVFGGGLGFALILGLALIDRRFRNPDDARTSAGRLALLGVLPSLPDDLADPEQAAISAHCVHQIRTLLQISSAGNDSRVFTITSPAAGTGKTSLTLALGVSFAAANSKTLMIDCDIIGGGLTARIEAIIRRKIGQVLRREGLISQQQLDIATRLAQNSQKRLGEILVDLGYLTEADVARALTVQEQSPIGMLEALAGENLEDCIAETGIFALDILPVGAAMPNDVGKLSPTSLRKLIEKARKHYETILIDTGPVPGSLEASIAAAAADGVVLVVSRGDHRPLAERSLQHLRDIGAAVAGMVFNRCENRDMDLVTTTNRLSSFDRGFRPADVRVVDGTQSTKFGPVARAVATGTSAQNPGKP
jgi:Mrp family chromosome partitioning ATPase